MPVKNKLANLLSMTYGLPYIPSLRFRQRNNDEIRELGNIGNISSFEALERLFIQHMCHA